MAFMWLVAFLVSTLTGYYWFDTRRRRNLPPGPRGLPLIGNIFSLGSDPHLVTQRWKEQYGDTFSFFIRNKPFIILSNVNTVRKVLGEDVTAGRPDRSTIRSPASPLPIGYGLISSSGNLWKTHRRFALSTLRDLGMGKNWLEDTIIAEVEGICQALRETHQRPFNPRVQLTNSVSNIICALIFGQRYELTDPKFSKLTNLLAENVTMIKYDFVAQAFPFLMWFPNYVQGKILAARRNFQELVDFLRETIREHDEVRRDKSQLPDYLHAYRNEEESQKTTTTRDNFAQNGDMQLVSSLFDLFAAGTETTSTTILWSFVFMVENPDIMKKVQAEIDTKVGQDKILTNSDRALLPYTEAVILEVQRFASLVPLGLPHMTHEETVVDGYVIPKGSFVAANLYSIHRDPRHWKYPNKFYPKHFLDDTSKLLRPEGFAPFSLGKRACPGEALAKMELFLFIANLLRCFTLESAPGKPISHHNSVTGLTLAPSPFELIFTPRIK